MADVHKVHITSNSYYFGHKRLPSDLTLETTGTGSLESPYVPVQGGSSYLVYTALLTQSGTNAPVVTVLQNTLGGTVVWTRDAVGYFTVTLTGAFPLGKTICLSEINYARQAGTEVWSSLGRLGNNEVNLIIKDSAFVDVDGFNDLSVIIQVYP